MKKKIKNNHSKREIFTSMKRKTRYLSVIDYNVNPCNVAISVFIPMILTVLIREDVDLDVDMQNLHMHINRANTDMNVRYDDTFDLKQIYLSHHLDSKI